MAKIMYKSKYDKLIFHNRWTTPTYSRNCDWTYLGFSIQWFSPKEYEYRLSVFGLDFRFWFKREVVTPPK